MDAEGSDDASLRRWRESRSQPIVPPSQINAEVDRTIDRIILRCLEVNPEQRYASAEELSADLQAYLRPSARAARWARRHRRGLLATAAAVVLSLAAGGAYWVTRPPAHEVYYQEGLRLHEQGNYAGAMDAFSQSVAFAPTSQKALSAHSESAYQEGLRLYAAGDYSRAIDALSLSLSGNPRSVKALFARGQSYYRQRDFDSAQQDFEAAAQLEDRGLFWFCAGCCGIATTDTKGGIALARAHKLGYDEAAVRCNLAVLMESKGRKGAIDEYTEAIRINPRLQEAFVERAFARMNEATAGNPEVLADAVTDIRQAEQLAAPSRRLYWLAARLHALSGRQSPADREQAKEYLLRWIAAGGDPKRHMSDAVLGKLLQELGRLDHLLREPDVRAAPDPPRGVLPPLEADLARLPGP
jgi:tetratricopeptide (TPR) repeat protein